MSHVATIEVEVKSLKALKMACINLGLEFVEGQRTYKWYGKWVQDYHGDDAAYKHGIKPEDYGKCDHAIRIPGNSNAYEIGVVRKANGSYAIVYDFWGPGAVLKNYIGQDGNRLKQEYALCAATLAAQAEGFSVKRVNQQHDGTIRLVIRKKL